MVAVGGDGDGGAAPGQPLKCKMVKQRTSSPQQPPLPEGKKKNYKKAANERLGDA